MFASLHWLRFLVLLSFILASSVAFASPACVGGNYLTEARLQTNRRVEHVERVTDEWFTLDGMPFDHPDAARFVSADGELVWDLGASRHLGVFELQADGNDSYLLEGATTVGEWTLLERVPPSSSMGLFTRTLSVPNVEVRYLRLRGEGGDGIYSVSELRAFCSEEERAKSPRRVHQNIDTPTATRRTISAYSAKLVMLGLLPLLAFWAFPRLRTRGRHLGLVCGLSLSALAWIQFGGFNGVSAIHGTDSFHYFMGSKYFRSVGYFELYPCIYKAERELGHGSEYQGGLVRDLADNRIWHSSWLDTPAGACHGQFSPEKWSEFKTDVTAFREILRGQVPMSRALVDHGYNATPFHTAFLRAFTLHVSAGHGSLLALAQLDSLALLLATLAIYWGFGGLGALLFALVLSTGAHWGYPWVGGSLGRHVWLAWAALGLSAARRERPVLAAVALTLSGLHRISSLPVADGVFDVPPGESVERSAAPLRASCCRRWECTCRRTFDGCGTLFRWNGRISLLRARLRTTCGYPGRQSSGAANLVCGGARSFWLVSRRPTVDRSNRGLARSGQDGQGGALSISDRGWARVAWPRRVGGHSSGASVGGHSGCCPAHLRSAGRDLLRLHLACAPRADAAFPALVAGVALRIRGADHRAHTRARQPGNPASSLQLGAFCAISETRDRSRQASVAPSTRAALHCFTARRRWAYPFCP
ncbi:MAG: hypothetical protein QM784_39780 [Polyangiaceae bacterium]